MKELIERIEGAEGPSRELDAEIIKLVSRGVLDGEYWTLPAYTASLDAAMTLVPEGWNVGIFLRHAWLRQNAQVWHRGIEASTKHGNAATPALALAAAALKARTATAKDDR